MILHTLNASPGSTAFDHCLAQVAADDGLLLMGNAVYAALANAPALARLRATGARLHVLEDDARTAGVTPQMSEDVLAIDFDAFVALSEQHARQVAWF
ncbi:sulfurtransferase complex subunit TusB [Parahaliea aestuarii]|uniref:Sulfurtransferase complex subunit TusB n=1 Tax=Parahaliea aestuarii TaxID=1852021 RepID=A0A5C8ZRJ3_9GAMM|nr:sulfurtransferase complex subunit TusB [Parahaliea aestuarii]TXS91108.1 sulfurtransferase complex subunit TusB [Parahaliea aestuarii]